MRLRTRRPGSALLGLVLSVLLVGSCTRSPAPDQGGSPGAADADLSTRIDKGLAPILGEQGAPVAIVVQVGGDVVYQRYDGTTPDEYRDVASVTKSVVSILVGIALHEGYLESVDQTLAELLPEYAGTMPAPVAATTLREVLTMTGGFVGEQYPGGFGFADARDPVRRILDGTVAAPGKQFIYSSAGPQLVSAILEHATGMSVLDYARTRLFAPLGIPSRPAFRGFLGRSAVDDYYRAGFAWPVDRGHHQLGWGRLKLRPVDMAELGTLYLDEGRWNGQQIVPRSWVRDSTSAQVETEGPSVTQSYGYQWWVGDVDGDPSFQAWGFGGQRILVIPARQLVLVVSQGFDMRDSTNDGTGAAPQITDVVLAALDDDHS